MSRSLIVSLDAAVQLRLQHEFPEASRDILSMEKLAQHIVFPLLPTVQLFSRYEQLIFQTKLNKGSIPPFLPLIRHLKRGDISVAQFRDAVSGYLFSKQKKRFYEDVVEFYAAYEQKKGWLDSEDILKKAAQLLEDSKEPLPFTKILLLAHELSTLEERFVSVLGKKAPEFQRSSPHVDRKSKSQKILVLEAKNREEEVSYVCDVIKREQTKDSKRIFIFCISVPDYEGLFKVAFAREKIRKITILPWRANSAVFGDMDTVFLVGLSHIPLRQDFVTDVEKPYFNEKLGKPIFYTFTDELERWKARLQRVVLHAQRVHVSYAKRLAAPFKEFLAEYSHYSMVSTSERKEPPKKAKKSKIRMTSLPFLTQKGFLLPDVYSMRSLTQYQKCPTGFLVRECLGLRPLRESGDILTPLQEGELLHLFLWQTFTAAKEGKVVAFKRCLSNCFDDMEKRFETTISEPERYRFEATLKAFIDEELLWRKESMYSPTYFEWSFGTRVRKDTDKASLEETLALKWKTMVIQLRGKVDRIDIDPVSKTFQIIDYKTGSTVSSEKEVRSGRGFQLTLYAEAVQKLLLPDYWPKAGYFYTVKMRQKKRAFELKSRSEWEQLREKTLEEVFSLVSKINKRQFPGTPDLCYTSCELKNFCERESI